jgi:hypothetical protein
MRGKGKTTQGAAPGVTGGSFHMSRTLRALRYRAAVRSNDSELVALLDDTLRDLHEPDGSPPAGLYEVYVDLDGAHTLRAPAGWTTTTADRAALLDLLVADLNRSAVASCGSDLIALHAAGVVHGPVGLVLPGRPDAGKTTLATGLVDAGWGYLSDEVVALDPAAGPGGENLLAYPKPLSVDPGTQQLFPHLWPPGPAGNEAPERRHVPASRIRAASVLRRARLGVVVLPEYTPGGETTLEQISRAEAVAELIRHSFNVRDIGAAALGPLAAVLRGCSAFRLRHSDLAEGLRALSSAVSQAVPLPEPAP